MQKLSWSLAVTVLLVMTICCLPLLLIASLLGGKEIMTKYLEIIKKEFIDNKK